MPRILGLNGRIAGQSGIVMSDADGAPCCCGTEPPPPPVGCNCEQTSLVHCAQSEYSCGEQAPFPFLHANAAHCHMLAITSAPPPFDVLNGLAFHTKPSGTAISIAGGAGSNDLSFGGAWIGALKILDHYYNAAFFVVAEPQVCDELPTCPTESGCMDYTGDASRVTITVSRGGLGLGEQPNPPGVITCHPNTSGSGPFQIVQETEQRPVNPCAVGAVTTANLSGTISHPFFGDTGLRTGLCGLTGSDVFPDCGKPPPPPPPEWGACCFPDDTCQVVSAAVCQGAGGQFLGSGTTCINVNCAGIGACCINGVCVHTTEPPCLAAGGLWQGIGTNCLGVECPPITEGGSQGLGDTVARFIPKGVKTVAHKLGCNCDKRQAWLNSRFPKRKRCPR